MSVDVAREAEQAVIAALLVEPEKIPLISGQLEPRHFGTDHYRDVYEAMLDLIAENRRVDVVTLRDHGVDTNDIALRSPGPNLEEHAQLVRDGAFRRSIRQGLDRTAYALDAGYDHGHVLRILSDMTKDVGLIGSGSAVDAASAVESYRRVLSERAEHGVGLPYGIPALDRYLQPAHGGDLVVVAARPSVGKSVLAEHIADTWAFESEHPVLFVSIEMSLAQLMDRAVARWGGVPSADIVRGVLTADQEARVATTLDARQQVNLWYMDDPYVTPSKVRTAAAEVSAVRGGITAIIVDYLQLMAGVGESDNQRVGRMSREIKALAREYDCPVLLLSQLSRRSEYREDPHPILSDLRDSGAIEQDADVVMGLWRDKDDPVMDNLMDISILKNRQGPLARVTIEFDGKHVRILADE